MGGGCRGTAGAAGQLGQQMHVAQGGVQCLEAAQPPLVRLWGDGARAEQANKDERQVQLVTVAWLQHRFRGAPAEQTS